MRNTSSVLTKERPILFSGEMVKAILAGRKTQTRRIVEPPYEGSPLSAYEHNGRWFVAGGMGTKQACPYGEPGDRLYVRESYYQRGHWETVTGSKARTRSGRQRWRFVPESDEITFDAPVEFRRGRHHRDPFTVAWHRRLGRFMFRRLSRITLEITGVRVERLQAISEEDAKAEGVDRDMEPCDHIRHSCADVGCMGQTHKSSFVELWARINGWDSWAANPLVWVVEFKRLEMPEVRS